MYGAHHRTENKRKTMKSLRWLTVFYIVFSFRSSTTSSFSSSSFLQRLHRLFYYFIFFFYAFAPFLPPFLCVLLVCKITKNIVVRLCRVRNIWNHQQVRNEREQSLFRGAQNAKDIEVRIRFLLSKAYGECVAVSSTLCTVYIGIERPRTHTIHTKKPPFIRTRFSLSTAHGMHNVHTYCYAHNIISMIKVIHTIENLNWI